MILTTLAILFLAILIVGLLWFGVGLLPLEPRFKQFAQGTLIVILIVICVALLLRLTPNLP